MNKEISKNLKKYLTLMLGASMVAGNTVAPFATYAADNFFEDEEGKSDKSIREELKNIEKEETETIDSNTDVKTVSEKKNIPEFGTKEFFTWFSDATDEEKTDWYNSIKKPDVATSSNLRKTSKYMPLTDEYKDDKDAKIAAEFWADIYSLNKEDGSFDYKRILKIVSEQNFNDAMAFVNDLSILGNSVISLAALPSNGSFFPVGYGDNADYMNHGNGTKESPYEIDSVEDLRGLAKKVAMGETYEDTYFILTKSVYDLNETWVPIGFKTTPTGSVTPFKGKITSKNETGSTITNLGFKGSASGITTDINESIKNSEYVGLFGLVEDALIENINVETKGGTVEGQDYVGLIAGKAINSQIKNSRVSGNVKGQKYVGGVVGHIESSDSTDTTRNSVIEDVRAQDVSVYISDKQNSHGAVGGITGYAKNTVISDVSVKTNTGSGKHIYGNIAYVGGVAGQVENADIYNSYVESGQIGSSDSYAVGGIVGGYNNGQIKVARFGAEIVPPTNSNNYKAAFIGTTVDGAGFTYGENGDIAYLYADTVDKASFGICGSKLSNDNQYGYDAHIGYWHSNDIKFTLVNGSNKQDSELEFYKELENGILNIKKTGNFTSETDDKKVNVNHFTCDGNGNPIRGYLLTVIDPQVDGKTAAEITASVNGGKGFKPTITSEKLGAFAPGDKIFIEFNNKSDDENGIYYRLDDTKAQNPYYAYHKYDSTKYEDADYIDDSDLDNLKKKTVTHDGGYWITMPDADTIVTAAYKAVAKAVVLKPEKINFTITQIRTGERENPDITWKITAKDDDGHILMDDKGGDAWNERKAKATTVENKTTYEFDNFNLGSFIGKERNEIFNLQWATENTAVAWTDGSSKPNAIISVPHMETNGQATDKKAYININVNDSAIADYVKNAEKKQKQDEYKDGIGTKKPIHFTSTISATAQTQDSSNPDTPAVGTLPIGIDFNIVDNTNPSLKGVNLDKQEIEYNVVRKLTGSRKAPNVEYIINGTSGSEAKAILNASFNPDYFSNDSVAWYLSDKADKDVGVTADENKQDNGTISVGLSGTGTKAYHQANVRLLGVPNGQMELANDTITNAFIKNKVDSENQDYTSQLKKVEPSASNYTDVKYVKITGHDTNNHSITATCKVIVNFKTVDETEIMPEKVEILDKNNIHNYEINYTFNGSNKTNVAARAIVKDDASRTRLSNGVGDTIKSRIYPEKDNTENSYQPFNKDIEYSLANPDITSNLNPNDVLLIDKNTGVITVRGFGESNDQTSPEYSPWVNSLIAQNILNGKTVKVRVIAKSVRDNNIVDFKDIDVSFKANTVENIQTDLKFDLVYTKENATGLGGTNITEKGSWSGNEMKDIKSKSTGTSEAPKFKVVDGSGQAVNDIVSLQDETSTGNETTAKVNPLVDSQWVKNLIQNRKNGNTGSQTVFVESQTTNGTPVSKTSVLVNVRYDGTDLDAKKVSSLPAKYPASPETITKDTSEETYDVKKANVKDRQIDLNVVATQGNFSDFNNETRKWSFGIVKLDNTTYSSQGVIENDASYELSDSIKDYVKVEDGYLVPIQGKWKSVIDAGETNGSVNGTITAFKEVDGKRTSDSFKVKINFRYDKAVIDNHKSTFDVVYTNNSRTNAVNGEFSGINPIKLNATIYDANGRKITPKWITSDPSIATVDPDGTVKVNTKTWIKEIIDKADKFDENTYMGQKTVKITATHPQTGETSDTTEITVNFRYDHTILNTNREDYTIVATQTSRTLNPSIKWSGNDIRKVDAKVFLKPGKDNNPVWMSEDDSIVKVDDAGNIQPVINSDWMKKTIAEHKFDATKVVAVNATDKEKITKDSVNVHINFKYEDVEMTETNKNMNITIKASGNRSNPVYEITGDKSKIGAVINSVNPEEKEIVFSSNDNGLLTVDANGNLSLVKPMITEKDGKVSMAQGTQFSEKAHQFLKDAIKHPFIDSEGARFISTKDVYITGSSKDGRMKDTTVVKLNVKYIDDTYSNSGGGGGGSHSGGGGGGGSTGVTTGGTKKQNNITLPTYVLNGGQWTQNARGDWFYTNGRTFSNEWAALSNPYADKSKGQSDYDWFHFGNDSVMTTGWFTENGDKFYLHPHSDGTQGRMYRGWNWIDDNGDGIAECYYFEPNSNGHMGAMHKSETVDGYVLNEKGQWTQNGVVITKDLRNNATTQNPNYVENNGKWNKNADGSWSYENNGNVYKNRWAAVANPYAKEGQENFSWFHFDENGKMNTGWFKDIDGKIYYLNPTSDGTLGRMCIGWNWIKGNDGKSRCYYFETASNGNRGAMAVNRTVDGSKVNGQGVWIINGNEITR